MNDYRPVALTSVIMKSFERIVKCHLFSKVRDYLDQHQFAYREGRGVEDAIVTVLHYLFQHLDGTGMYVRAFFVDFGSAFNTIQPHLLMLKLDRLGVDPNLILWINSYLLNEFSLSN